MQIQCYTLGAIGTHCYFLINPQTDEVLVVDPADHPEVISKKITQQGLNMRGILLTHGHGDHIMAVPELCKTYQVPVLAHESEKQLLATPRMNLSGELFGRPLALTADQLLRDGETVNMAGLSLQVLFTPGHTPGGCCYYSKEDGILLSGDTLFYGSVGRTDFPGGSMRTLIGSIREKLMCLPDETKVYPGHSEMTTIGQERKYNPYFAG